MKFYSLDVDEVFINLKSNKEGLSFKDARERLIRYGKNRIVGSKRKSNLVKFLSEFKDLMIVILILSAICSFVLSILNDESFTNSIIILTIVILNGIFGFMQEIKADKAIEALKEMQVSNVKVKRDSKICVINSEDVVKGDILVLEAGDRIPADARVIWVASLKVDESSLTGECIPVSKDIITLKENVPLSQRKNMIYAGTCVVYGKCHAVVCETGMNTEFGIIAKSLSDEEKEITPLQVKINGISKFLSIIIFLIIVAMFIIGIVKKMNIMEIIMLSISLAVAAIPEGLPAIITIILALGTNTMAKKHAIVRKMSSVETLGSTEVICSDKTGTITQNKMKVREVYYNNKICLCENLEKDNILLSIMALNNDVLKNSDCYMGDPTEIALYEACEEVLNINDLKSNNKRIGELPFDSDRKMMSIVNKNENSIMLYTKGSFNSVIKHCSYVYEGNSVKKLTKNKIIKLEKIEKQEAFKAYRVLAFAYKVISDEYVLDKSLENNLIFVGMVAMADPPRFGVQSSISECIMAHIKPVMITGDSLATAVSIAKEVGILNNEEDAISGEFLDKMTKEELAENVNKYSVYARVNPMNKLDIVNTLKENGKVVAVIGDGVNDAPALKSADIGVGMGLTGTDVSNGVADIILADDSFATIVTAIKEGRRIFDNIRNVLVYLLTGNIAEVLVVFVGMLFGIEVFLPIQLLYINLITDSVPAIALAFESSDENIMKRSIRKSDSSFFTPFLMAKIGLSAFLKTIAVLFVYFINLKLYSMKIACTMSFLTLILLEMVFAYSCRNLKKNIIGNGLFDNKYMNKSMLILGLVQIVIFVTSLKSIFGIVSLSIVQVIYCFIIVILVFLIDELLKNLISKLFKD